MNITEYRQAIAKNMSERTLQTKVEQIAREFGWLFYHTHDSRRSQAGFPDVVFLHPKTGRLIVRELKDMRRKPTTEQTAWLDAFKLAGIDAGIWRPIDYLNETVLNTLMQTSSNHELVIEDAAANPDGPPCDVDPIAHEERLAYLEPDDGQE